MIERAGTKQLRRNECRVLSSLLRVKRAKSYRLSATMCVCTTIACMRVHCVELSVGDECVCVHFSYLRHKVRVYTKMFGSRSSKINSHSAKTPYDVLVLMFAHVHLFISLISFLHLLAIQWPVLFFRRGSQFSIKHFAAATDSI